MTTLLLSARPAATSKAPGWRGWSLGPAAALALQLGLALPAPAQDADPVVARVNGVEVRASDLAVAEEDVGSNLPPMTSDGKRDYLITFVADMILVAKAAEAKKIPDGDDFKRRLAYFRNKILMETLLQSEAKSSLSDAALRKVYEDATKQMAGDKEVHARHILVETEDEAKAILAELKKGGDFAELAKQKSKDPGAAEGGDLGFFTKDQMVPEFAEVAFNLEKGKLSDPVKTQFGWHIIKVEESRERAVPKFDQVKEQLESYVTRKAQAELITKLRAEGKIERLEAKPDPTKPDPTKPDPAKPAGEPKK